MLALAMATATACPVSLLALLTALLPFPPHVVQGAADMAPPFAFSLPLETLLSALEYAWFCGCWYSQPATFGGGLWCRQYGGGGGGGQNGGGGGGGGP